MSENWTLKKSGFSTFSVLMKRLLERKRVPGDQSPNCKGQSRRRAPDGEDRDASGGTNWCQLLERKLEKKKKTYLNFKFEEMSSTWAQACAEVTSWKA